MNRSNRLGENVVTMTCNNREITFAAGYSFDISNGFSSIHLPASKDRQTYIQSRFKYSCAHNKPAHICIHII